MTARGSTTNNNTTKTFISVSPNSSLYYHDSGLPMDVIYIYVYVCVRVPVCVCVCMCVFWRKVGGWRRKMERSKRVDRAELRIVCEMAGLPWFPSLMLYSSSPTPPLPPSLLSLSSMSCRKMFVRDKAMFLFWHKSSISRRELASWCLSQLTAPVERPWLALLEASWPPC